MHVEVTLMMTSRSSRIFGSGTLLTRTSYFPHQVRAFMDSPSQMLQPQMNTDQHRWTGSFSYLGSSVFICGSIATHADLHVPRGWPSVVGTVPVSIRHLKRQRSSLICCFGSWPNMLAIQLPTRPAGGM